MGKVLSDKAKSKKDKVVKTDKRDKNLFYNPQHSFAKFKDISDFNEMSLDSMHEKLNEFQKKFDGFKKLIPKPKKNEDLKAKVLDDSGDLFNELY